jgi:teichuronic acid biosynthesis glycosyltransferase TuaC
VDRSSKREGLRVLCFTNMWPSDDQPWRGQFVVDQVEDLRRESVSVEVLSFHGRRSRSAYFAAAVSFQRALRAGSFDLVHAHYGLSDAVACLQRRVPVVTTFHGSDVHLPEQRRFSRFAARRSTPICVNRAMAAALARPDAHIVPVGVDLELFQPVAREEARRTLGLEGRRYLLFPGRIGHPPKRYELFAEMLERVPAEQLVLDHVPREQVPALLNAADVLVMTSRHEGAPLSVKEALAVQTPVVSVDVGDVADVVRDLPGCEIAAPTPDALAAAVLRALEAGRDPALRRRAAEYGRRETAQRILAIYEEALKQSAARARGRRRPFRRA